MDTYLEDWEQGAIWALVWKYIVYGLLGTAVTFSLAHFLISQGWGHSFDTTLYFLPWAVVLVLGTFSAFHQGVVDEFLNVTGYKSLEEAAAKEKNIPVPGVLMESWEKSYAIFITFRLILLSIFGTFALYGFVISINVVEHPYFSLGMVFTPWLFFFIWGASCAYHDGVIAHRRHLRGRRNSDRRLGPRRDLKTIIEEGKAPVKKKAVAKKKPSAKKQVAVKKVAPAKKKAPVKKKVTAKKKPAVKKKAKKTAKK